MFRRLTTTLRLWPALLVLAPSFIDAHAAGPVYLEAVADQSFTPGEELAPFNIRFIVHPNGNRIQGMAYPAIFGFTNGNIIGTIQEGTAGNSQVIYSPASKSVFQTIAWNQGLGDNPTDPDSMLLGMVSFDKQWTGTGELFRIHVVPLDTGSIIFDTCSVCNIPPYSGSIGPHVQDSAGADFTVVTLLPTIHVPPKPGAVRFRIITSTGTDTLFMGSPARIFFTVDADGQSVAGLTFILQWMFSNGNIVGPFSDVSGEVEYSHSALQAFETIAFNSGYGQGTNPDTSLVGLVSFDTTGFRGDDWIWSVAFSPTDTGTIFIDSNLMVPPANVPIDAQGFLGASLPSNFIPGRIVVVPCPYDQLGDMNQDSVLTSADLIYFINYMFKSGPDPLPERSIADVNCSGGLGGSDIIYLVNYLFKGGAAPCACIVRRI